MQVVREIVAVPQALRLFVGSKEITPTVQVQCLGRKEVRSPLPLLPFSNPQSHHGQLSYCRRQPPPLFQPLCPPHPFVGVRLPSLSRPCPRPLALNDIANARIPVRMASRTEWVM